MRVRERAGPAVVAVLMAAGSAQAVTPAERCESGKNTEAGKYAYCRQKAESKFALTGDAAARTTALQRCLTKYDAKWPRLESTTVAVGGACPSTGDQTAIRSYLDTTTTNVATALSGGTLPACDGDLLACQGDLGDCTGDLAVCGGDLTTCQGNLGTTQASLITCTTDLGTCNTTLGTTPANLATCTGNLTTCSANLGTCTGDLTTCTGDLANYQSMYWGCYGALNNVESGYYACVGNYHTAQALLSMCGSNLAACQATSQAGGQRLKTGQMQCWDEAGTPIACAGTGQDGDLQKGLDRAYVDNGDGTITDRKTGLMWEKLSDDGGIHDKDTLYTWTNAFSKVALLNTGAFGGYNDWRLPNRSELDSLVALNAIVISVPSEFDTGCTAGCTIFSCSCTQAEAYWTSSTYQNNPQLAWFVYFVGGSVNAAYKTESVHVRAVRGGS